MEPTQVQIAALESLMGTEHSKALRAAGFDWSKIFAIIQALLAAFSTKQGTDALTASATLGFDWGKLFSFVVTHWQEILDIFKPAVVNVP